MASSSHANPTPAQINRSGLAAPKWGLAWSNPYITNKALVCNALKHGGFDHVLQAAIDFGLEFVNEQFREIEGTLRPAARADLQRMLSNIEIGFSDAAT